MSADAYTLFDSPLGTCGIVWSEAGIRRVQLPERDTPATERLISEHATRVPEPPPFVQDAIRRVRCHLEGKPQCFDGLRLDLSAVSPFYRRVYDQARRIPCGEVRAYSDLAVAVGQAGAARAVGQALSRNPIPIIIPCHRILTRAGKGGGFSAFGGLTTKAILLALEGVHVGQAPAPVPAAPITLWDGGHLQAGVDSLRLQDERLSGLLLQVGPCTLCQDHPGEPFAALVESIIYQQLAGKAAAAIVRRFQAACGGFPTAEDVLSTPAETLRGAGLSTAKIAAIQTLARAIVLEGLDLPALSKEPDAEVRRVLTAHKGIGPWTVDMFLIFHLGRPDVFPVGDLAIRKAMQRLYRLRNIPDAARLEKLTLRWKPYRTVATWYLWRSLGVMTLGVATEVVGSPAPQPL